METTQCELHAAMRQMERMWPSTHAARILYNEVTIDGSVRTLPVVQPRRITGEDAAMWMAAGRPITIAQPPL